MNEKKKQELKKKLSKVPNPPVPNRAHTEMKIENKKAKIDPYDNQLK